MRITHYTDYSLRVLMYLATERDTLTTVSKIAHRFSISRHHLMKVIHGLAEQGFIETVRGCKGGVRIVCAPEQVSVGEVIRCMEKTLEIIECNRPSCPLTPGCALKGALLEARDGFLHILDRYTLTDMVDETPALIALAS